MGDLQPLVCDELKNPEGRAIPPGGRVGASSDVSQQYAAPSLSGDWAVQA